MFLYILGINVILIILIYKLWLYYVKYDCENHKSHDRWKKDVTYMLLKDKYNMTNQITLFKSISKLPTGFNYPVVLKPIDMGQGYDVFTDIYDDLELKLLSSRLIKKYKTIVLENQVLNKRECRVLINTKVNHFSITERLPIEIIGDGVNDIEFLVRHQNKINKLKINHYNDYHKIIIDDRIIDKKKIPYLNERVLVNNRKNSSLGGDIKIMDVSKVHSDNIKLFYNIMEDINSTHNGLDILFDDLSVSYKVLPIILLEVNFCPGYNEKRLWNAEFDTGRYSLYKTILGGLLIFNTVYFFTNYINGPLI